jgi:hypothetical protein
MSSYAQTYEQAANDARKGDELEDDRVGNNPGSSIRVHMVWCWPQGDFCARSGVDVRRHVIETC